MKRLIPLFLMCIFLTGCTEACKKQLRHTKSNFVGLQRKVTVYLPNGETKIYEGRFKVEQDGLMIAFIDDNNKEIKVPAGITIVEEQ
jgi:hypothetical protein